ncbi:hypothetical protein ACWCQ0_49635 [Streptomyces massasporeus]
MTLVPPVPVPAAVPAAETVVPDGAAVDSAVVNSTDLGCAVADRPEIGAREAAPVPSGLPVPPPRPADTEHGQELEHGQEQAQGQEQELEQGQEQELVPTPEPAPESVGPSPAPAPGPRLRHVRIGPPAGPRGGTDDPAPRVPGTPPRFGVVAVPQPSRTTSDRRSGTPSVRPVRLTGTAARPPGLPGATERPAAVTPVPLPVPRPVTPAGPDAPVDPAGPVTPAVPPSTESRTEEPQP